MTSLPDWLKQKRDELAYEYIDSPGSAGLLIPDSVILQCFEEGFDAAIAIMSEREKIAVESFEQIKREVRDVLTPNNVIACNVDEIVRETLAKLKET